MVAVGGPVVTYDEAGSAPVAVPPAPKSSGQAQAQAQTKAAPAGTVLEFPLPEIGEGVVEGEVVEWHVKPGDRVEMDMPVVAILTDKATVEINAPASGVVVATFGEPGDMVKVGVTLMTMTTAGGAQPPAVVAPVAAVAAPAAAAAVSATAAATAPVRVAASAPNPSISAFGTPLATPAVRRLAAQVGVDLFTLVGSGPKHRITRADVEGAKAAPAKIIAMPVAESATPAASGGEKREKLKGMRKAIYTSMTKSKATIPHFTYVDEVEMDALVAMRNALKETAAREGVKLTYLPFIVKAVVLALKKFPMLNASLDDEAGEIVYKYDYNIGIATATEAGLTVPVLKGADKKPILELAREMVAITDRARERKSTLQDISGGTFTVTSLGRLGGLLSTPIINHPEVGILGIHNLAERPVVRNGQIVIRQMMNIALSFDHRLVDGDVGASFAQEVKAYLEEPGKLLLYMV